MLRYISGPNQDVIPEAKVAIVTVVIGMRHRTLWEASARTTWERYAKRHSFDILVITDYLDTTPQGTNRSPAWQKCLILSQPWSTRYEQIVWLDADIFISPEAPSVLTSVPIHKIGAVVDNHRLSLAERHALWERVSSTHKPPGQDSASVVTLKQAEQVVNAYTNYLYRHFERIETQETRIIQTGVLVLNAWYHRFILETAYQYPEYSQGYEQLPLSLLIFHHDILEELNPRFNWYLHEICTLHFPVMLGATYETMDWNLFGVVMYAQIYNSFFLHFAGVQHLMEMIKGITIEPRKRDS